MQLETLVHLHKSKHINTYQRIVTCSRISLTHNELNEPVIN